MPFNIRIAPFGGSVKLFAPTYVPGGGLPPGATFTRSTEGAEQNVDGSASFRAANVLRESHYRGAERTMLLEPTATNLNVQSNPNAAGWLTFGGVDGGAVVGADAGALTGRRFTHSAVNTQLYRLENHAAGNYALSHHVKHTGPSAVRISAYGTPNSNDYTSADLPLVAGWQRIVHARNMPTVLSQFPCIGRAAGGSTGTVDYSLFQLEAGLIPSSPIRTVGVALARGADVWSFPSGGTLYELYYTTTGALVETVRAYVAGTSITGAEPRFYLKIKLGLGNYSLAQMKAKP